MHPHLQGPEEHTNIKEYVQEAGLDVLPALPGRRSTVPGQILGFSFLSALGYDPPDSFSLTYVAFFKPGPLGTPLGPTLAENLPKPRKTKIYILASDAESK